MAKKMRTFSIGTPYWDFKNHQPEIGMAQTKLISLLENF